jgi:hypothetical protein
MMDGYPYGFKMILMQPLFSIGYENAQIRALPINKSIHVIWFFNFASHLSTTFLMYFHIQRKIGICRKRCETWMRGYLLTACTSPVLSFFSGMRIKEMSQGQEQVFHGG